MNVAADIVNVVEATAELQGLAVKIITRMMRVLILFASRYVDRPIAAGRVFPPKRSHRPHSPGMRTDILEARYVLSISRVLNNQSGEYLGVIMEPCIKPLCGVALETLYDKEATRNQPSSWYLVSPSGRSAPPFLGTPCTTLQHTSSFEWAG